MFIRSAIIIFLLSATAFSAQAQNGGALEAREITADDTRSIISASGDVEFSSTTSRLTTNNLTYNQNTQQLVLTDELRLIDENGDTIVADSGVLDNALEKGNFVNMRLSTAGGSRLQAKSARRNGTQLALEDATYTTCPECEEPDKAPLWQIRASRIDYDREAQNVIYVHPRLEVYGLPIFYLPYMAHAGPEIDKRSGFLTPSYVQSNDFGTALEMPYFFNLAPNYDLTLTPRLSDQQDPFITGEWRHLTGNGSYRLVGYAHRPQDELAKDSDQELRGAIIGDGQFVLHDWLLNFAVQDATDDLFLRRYKISNEARLSTNLSAQRRLGNHFISLETFHFRETLSAETASTVGAILPSLTHHYDFPEPVFGGSLAMTNQLTHRQRDLDVDETRLSSMLNWSWRHITRSGFVLSANNRLTLDAYDFTIEEGDESSSAAAAIDEVLSANSAAFTLAYPLQRTAQNDRQTLSPKLQLVLADAAGDYDAIPHIGQTTRDLTKSQLFQPLTPKDEASRINLGLDHELSYKDRLTSRFFIGQSYNLSDESFDLRSGFGDDRSALITEAALYAGALSLTQQARFNDDASALLRSDSKMALAFEAFNIGFDHSFYEAGQTGANSDDPLEEATGRLGWQMSRNWRLDASLRENLEGKKRVRADAAFTYEDDCTLITISFDRDYSRIQNIEPNTSVNFTFTLKTIGN